MIQNLVAAFSRLSFKFYGPMFRIAACLLFISMFDAKTNNITAQPPRLQKSINLAARVSPSDMQ